MTFDRDRFARAVNERIENKDVAGLFEGGCCYHFAIRAFERGLGPLVRVPKPEDPSLTLHAFVQASETHGLDYKGVRPLAEIDRQFFGSGRIVTMSEAEVRSKIAERGLPEDLAIKVFEMADQIINVVS